MTGSSRGDRLQLEPAPPDIEVRVNPRAGRILLRADSARCRVILVLPSEADRAKGLSFAAQKAAWIRARLSEMRDRVPFEDGMKLPLMGSTYTVRHAPAGRNLVAVSGDEILVAGPAARLAGQLAAWLRAEAYRHTSSRSRALAAKLDARIARVAVRDTRSRWGSCSTAGGLSFSWRLVLAPERVLDYVVAHEVAHLKVPDHSQRFWRLVAELHPGYPAERRWLKQNGAALHRYG